jgi:hypothetical protein
MTDTSFSPASVRAVLTGGLNEIGLGIARRFGSAGRAEALDADVIVGYAQLGEQPGDVVGET